MSDKKDPDPDNEHNDQQAKIPKGRFSRFARLGGMASKIAGNMLSEGVSEMARGNRPKVKDLLLTPNNILRVADQLAQMRGAAMKVGQLISMDAGDVLPKELSDILARLRSDAKSMPEKELVALLEDQWGPEWKKRFIQFPMKPIAAASIGQVHKGISQDLKRLAIKIQYPGIKQSINSDVDNVATLIKLSGLLPKNLDIKPLLAEAKLQLHDEANYSLEAQRIRQYADVIRDDPSYVMPQVDDEFCSELILAMTFVDGIPVEDLIGESQQTRNFIVEKLLVLFFKELFDHQLIQTDPNFANYQYDQEHKRVVLLDFGATRDYSKDMAQGYLELAQGAYTQNSDAVATAVEKIGLVSAHLPNSVKQTIFDLCYQACEPLYTEGEYDFGKTDLLLRLRDEGMALSLEKTYAHTPPVNCIFLHRKLGGLFLLAIRLQAKVDVRALFEPYAKINRL